LSPLIVRFLAFLRPTGSLTAFPQQIPVDFLTPPKRRCDSSPPAISIFPCLLGVLRSRDWRSSLVRLDSVPPSTPPPNHHGLRYPLNWVNVAGVYSTLSSGLQTRVPSWSVPYNVFAAINWLTLLGAFSSLPRVHLATFSGGRAERTLSVRSRF